MSEFQAGPLLIAKQGSFAIGGSVRGTPGAFDPFPIYPGPEGQTLHTADAVAANTGEYFPAAHLVHAVDAAAKAGATSVYVEILSKHGVRVLKAKDDYAEPQQDAQY